MFQTLQFSSLIQVLEAFTWSCRISSSPHFKHVDLAEMQEVNHLTLKLQAKHGPTGLAWGAVGWGKGEQPRRLSWQRGKCFLSLCAGLYKIPWVMLPMQLCWGFTCSTEASVLSPLELFCRTLIFIPPCP